MRIVLIAALVFGASQASAQPYAYIPEYTSNSVSVIDDATQTVVDNIPVGGSPWGVSISPDSSLAYITNYGAGTISVIDTGTNTVIATEATGGNPYGVAFSPDGSLAYVTSFNTSTLQTFDTATHTLVDTLPLANDPYGLAFTPDGSKLYVSNYSGSAVSVIDTATLTVSATIPAGNGPLHVAMSPDGATVVVANGNNNNLLIVDTATDTTITTIPVGFRATGVAVSNDGTMAVVTSDSSNDIAIVDLDTATLTTSIPMGAPTWGVDFTPDGSQFYVTMLNGSVRIFDTGTLAVSATVPLTGTAYAHGNFFAHGIALPPPIAQGVQLDALPPAPVVYAEEIIASPGAPVTLLNPAGDLNLSANIGYNFSIGEVRYARFECDSGLVFDAGSAAVYDGAGNAALGAINGLGDSAMHFSITANDNNVTDGDRLVITGDRQITGTDANVNCTYSLYDFPSQAAAGGPAGRVYSVSGPYITFAPSYALDVDVQGNPVADVESGIPAFAEFTLASPTNDTLLGRIGGFSYGTRQDMGLGVQPLTPAGPAITLADLMAGDTALIFTGDFSAAADVFFSPNADCSVNIQSADDFSEVEAVFTIGNADALAHQLCFLAGTTPIPASDYTVALDAVPVAPTVYAVADLGPLALGRITRNGTELQAPLAQVPGGWLSRIVLTNTGPVGRAFRIEVFGEAGNTITTSGPMSGVIEAEATRVIDLDTVLTGFTGAPRATVKLTVAAPTSQVQGLYQIVNPDSGSISNHVMVRPGTN